MSPRQHEALWALMDGREIEFCTEGCAAFIVPDDIRISTQTWMALLRRGWIERCAEFHGGTKWRITESGAAAYAEANVGILHGETA